MEELFKVDQVAKMFEVQPATVRDWLKSGVLKGIKIGTGHYWRIPASEVDRLSNEWHGGANAKS